MSLPDLIQFYENLTPESVDRFTEFYTDDAYFKDPFNEVNRLEGIQRIFRHMFQQVSEPCFRITEQIVDEHGAMLVWRFQFHPRALGRCQGAPQEIQGVSHLRFAADGRVNYHRDYWDTAEELYFKVPGLGLLMRGLKKALSA